MSNQREHEIKTQQLHNECCVDHDVEDQTRPPDDNGGVDHKIERAIKE